MSRTTRLSRASGYADGNRDTLFIDARANQLWFRRRGNDLVIDIMGSQDGMGNNPSNTVSIQNHYAGTQYQIERIVSNDAKVLAAADANALVMALSNQLETSGAGSFDDVSMLIQKRVWQAPADAAWRPDATVSNLITAMAQMAPPAAGTTLSAADYQNRASAIYAANVMV
ncbi:calcium-binding protein [Propionivibrio dicarboxylicus]|uniref:Haemolysin-type calcium binding protein related domain-containing protein n=1 Tax=Propionivibrio dicarboxylicus TaxID=83767 RepID=A0A1G8MI72_9RHOO|nr:calcium-binding protein [Propionivibrio dicarboxylicus]SDI67020.1 Haemolysin-type calcium binding protein related domain-containing protein [Propionivibrio dicarboxylicus]